MVPDLQVPQVDSEGGTVIRPEPGYVVKALSSDGATRKVFINLCSSSVVGDPSEDPAGIRVPMSIGETRIDTDKKGEECTVVDVIVSGETLRNSLLDPRLKSTLIDLVLRSVNAKHSLVCEFKSCPVLLYKGGPEVREQRVKMIPRKIIQEILLNALSTKPPKFTMTLQTTEGAVIDALTLPMYQTTEHLLHENLRSGLTPRREDDSESREIKKCQLSIPCVKSALLVKLQVSQERLVFTNTGLTGSSFQVWFPEAMNPESCSAIFVKARREVLVEIETLRQRFTKG